MKSLSTLHIATLCLYLSTQTFCMETVLTEKNKISPFPNNIINLNNQLERESFSSLLAWSIDIDNTLQFNKFKTTWHTNQTKDPTKEIKNIENELQQLQQQIDLKENKTLLTIKENNNIPDKDWNRCTRMAQHLNSFEEENKYFGLSNYKHDKKIPKDFRWVLKKILKANDINPTRITFQHNTEGIFVAVPPTLSFFPIAKSRFRITIESPGFINVDPQRINILSPTARKGLCILLVALTKRDLVNHAEVIISLTKAVIDYNSLEKANLTLTLLTLALKSEHNAKLLKQFCKEINRSNICTTEDYRQLSEIHRLHETLECLKKYVTSDPEKPITTDNNETDQQK